MRVWLVQPSEQLPLVANARRLRTRLLAEELTRRGHEVTWWASCFNHLRKEWYCPTSMRIQAEPCPRVQLLKGIGYSRNVSLRRWVDHRMLSRAFSASAAHEPPPDVVVACLPPYDLAAAAVKFAKRCGARAIVDIRDTWPDNFLGGPAPVPSGYRAHRADQRVRPSQHRLGWSRRVGCGDGTLAGLGPRSGRAGTWPSGPGDVSRRISRAPWIGPQLDTHASAREDCEPICSSVCRDFLDLPQSEHDDRGRAPSAGSTRHHLCADGLRRSRPPASTAGSRLTKCRVCRMG